MSYKLITTNDSQHFNNFNKRCNKADTTPNQRVQEGDVAEPTLKIERGREQGHSQIYKDYFSEMATYQDEVFRRRFIMRKPIFIRIVEQLEGGM